ncbi:cofactor-independent phosphoglycerate mutase, partial [bacterium]|nr:cofactor-independent phosphoglycerate mutase [bacterium]
MKYIVLIGDGMSDYPLKELGNRTPLEAAQTPNMDSIAKEGIVGTVKTIPEDLPSGSGVANLNVLGYDPRFYYTGRGPIEAANMGIILGKNDIAFRCNLITAKKGILFDYSAGHISDGEAKELIEFIDEKLGDDNIEFYPGTSYRHLMIIREAIEKSGLKISDINKIKCVPPHDITGKEIENNLPKNEGSSFLIELMEKSSPFMESHEVNKKRVADGKNPANMIWLWGQGKKPAMPSFKEKFGIGGSIISAVNLIKGIGICIGLKVINVPGATGFLDTNYKGKAEAALDSLKENDFVFVHVEAPDEAGHMGDAKKKIQAIEDFDKLVVGTILQGCKDFNEYKILVLPDHPTPISLMTHSREPVP